MKKLIIALGFFIFSLQAGQAVNTSHAIRGGYAHHAETARRSTSQYSAAKALERESAERNQEVFEEEM